MKLKELLEILKAERILIYEGATECPFAEWDKEDGWVPVIPEEEELNAEVKTIMVRVNEAHIVIKI